MRKRPPLPYRVPKLPTHTHPAGCACEPAAIYLRVSKVGKRSTIRSPEDQFHEANSYAERNSFRVVAIVTDIDKSGRTFRKRSVDMMINDIKAEKFRCIIFWKWSRWARSVADSTIYLKRVRDAGGRVVSATEDFDQNTALGKLQLNMVGSFDQYFSDSKSEDWKAVLEKRADLGLPRTGRARFGYEYVSEVVVEDWSRVKKDQYVIKESQAPDLRRCYEIYNSGQGFAQVAKMLNGQGHLTTLGGRWTAQGVGVMMDTGFAAGLIRERSNPTDKPASRLDEYDVWREGAHTPVIDRATWDKYLLRRKERINMPARLRRPTYPLSGRMYCMAPSPNDAFGVCGRRLQSKHLGAAMTHNWVCCWSGTHHPGVNVSVSNRLAMIHLRNEIRRCAGEGVEVDRMAKASIRRLAKQRARADQLDVDADRWRKKIQRLVDLYTDEVIERSQFTEKKIEYEDELRRVLVERHELGTDGDAQPNYRAFRTLDEEWDSLDPARLNEAIGALFGAITVSPRTPGVSSNKSAADRVSCIPRWESERLSWMQRSA